MIPLKSPREIEIMGQGGRKLALIMEELKKEVRPGIQTMELEEKARNLVSRSGGICSFLNYQDPGDRTGKPFPACLCVSVNEEIVHAPPSERILKKGDIVSLDLGLSYQGFHTDMAITVAIGKVEDKVLRLIKVTEKALEMGIEQVRPGNTIGDVENAIQEYVESQGFGAIEELCGHGIGRQLHEEPQILNYGKKGTGPSIAEGMVLCLEPMVSMAGTKIERRGFVFKTKDNSLSAHFENTIAVNKNRPLLLTRI